MVEAFRLVMQVLVLVLGSVCVPDHLVVNHRLPVTVRMIGALLPLVANPAAGVAKARYGANAFDAGGNSKPCCCYPHHSFGGHYVRKLWGLCNLLAVCFLGRLYAAALCSRRGR